jgi:hypothetical protein
VKKIIVRIQGGLGNQLFCYAAARRLALVNDAELVLDNVTGFARDRAYKRSYQLHHLSIPCRIATRAERMEPFERVRRKALRELSRALPFGWRPYLAQDGDAFDPRLLERRVCGLLYLDGLWQSEDYFKDVESQIRSDLAIEPPTDPVNCEMEDRIASTNAVALHVRWFDAPGSREVLNAPERYYRDAIAKLREHDAHFFIFSDRPKEARDRLGLDERHATVIAHNRGDAQAYADLYLMAKCRHFITANSTFSWWGAWLASNPTKQVIVPRVGGVIGAWNFAGQIPRHWVQL